jgi:hypothetical protein
LKLKTSRRALLLSKKPLRQSEMTKSGLQRRLQKLESRSLAHTLAAQPEGESKRFLIARIEAIRQRRQALGVDGEYAPRIEVGEIKERLRAFLAGREKRA